MNELRQGNAAKALEAVADAVSDDASVAMQTMVDALIIIALHTHDPHETTTSIIEALYDARTCMEQSPRSDN